MVEMVAVIPLLYFKCILCVLLQVFRRPWPGIMRTVYRNHERFENTYFKKFPGFYVTGDGKPQKYLTSTVWTLKFTHIVRHKSLNTKKVLGFSAKY